MKPRPHSWVPKWQLQNSWQSGAAKRILVWGENLRMKCNNILPFTSWLNINLGECLRVSLQGAWVLKCPACWDNAHLTHICLNTLPPGPVPRPPSCGGRAGQGLTPGRNSRRGCIIKHNLGYNPAWRLNHCITNAAVPHACVQMSQSWLLSDIQYGLCVCVCEPRESHSSASSPNHLSAHQRLTSILQCLVFHGNPRGVWHSHT